MPRNTEIKARIDSVQASALIACAHADLLAGQTSNTDNAMPSPAAKP